jgi:PPM family protein phosphatase
VRGDIGYLRDALEREGAKLDVGSATHVGLVRDTNEDALLVADERRVFAVADGLGGHPAGEVASELAVRTIDGQLSAEEIAAADNPGKLLTQTLQAAHRAILEDASDDPGREGMGTTAVVSMFPDGSRDAWVAHVGDSRAYLLRNGELHQLTEDHASNGLFGRGGITQALGTQDDVEPDFLHIEFEAADRLVMCTDGLTDMLGEDDIARIVDDAETAQDACDLLVEAAMGRGGVDNITVIVVDVAGGASSG